MGLLAHTGEVWLDGMSGPAARIALAPGIAYVPQVAPAMAVTVGDIMRTVAGVRGQGSERIAAIATELGLGLGPILKQPFRGLSGGMKQKLLIALALGVHPRLVILDEPTASLDAAARARFRALEREHLAGATVILCSHRLDELRTMVDRVVALDEGRVVHDGPAAAYVASRTQTVIDVLAEGGSDDAWLLSMGFLATSGGWWSRAVDHDEKLRLLPELMATLGARMRDVVVRDLERIDAAGGGADVGGAP
jgi:ABC-2 type transport system ATP-binding protein